VSPKPNTRVLRRAFTLIEILVVIVIIAILASLVAPQIFRYVDDAKTGAAKSQVETLALALNAYRLDNGVYPSSQQGLEALRTLPTSGEIPKHWRGPYLARQVPVDPWERPYIYVSPGHTNLTTFDLYTLGRDGKIGGTGDDADVTSWGGSVITTAP